jgi:hypothetical protein
MIQKHQTACCALWQITASNEDSLEALDEVVNKIKKSADRSWTPSDRSGGERAIFIIIAPGEEKLRENVETLGFSEIANFDRRNGYPLGVLKMYMRRF